MGTGAEQKNPGTAFESNSKAVLGFFTQTCKMTRGGQGMPEAQSQRECHRPNPEGNAEGSIQRSD